MGEIYIETIKYIKLALDHYIPILNRLVDKQENSSVKEELIDLLNMYIDIGKKLDKYNLNVKEPYRHFDDEPEEIEINFKEKVIENLAMLTKRMLDDWNIRYAKLNSEDKIYITKEEIEEKYILKNRIQNLEVYFHNEAFLLHKYDGLGALKFPNETINPRKKKVIGKRAIGYKVFPSELLPKLPADIKELCEDFDFNMQHKKSKAAMLILRNLLPQSIVRKFQQMNKEEEILVGGDYLDTKALLGKIENYLKEKRIYSELVAYKPLIDSSQHFYSTKIWSDDAGAAAVKVRLLLEQIYG